MFFSGHCFASGSYSLDTTPPTNLNVNSIVISNGVFDELFVSKNTIQDTSSPIPDIWDYDTVLHAYFRDNLRGGNVNFTINNTDALRIKRCVKGSFDWVTMFEIPIYDINSFSFEMLDVTPRSMTEYEYCLVPVFGSVEGSYIVNNVTTEFDGLFILERDRFFSTTIAVSVDPQKQNKISTVVPTLGHKYPFVISNGLNNYKSGTVSAVFAQTNNNCVIDFKNSWRYRESLNDFLLNGLPKLIKYEDGRMWLVSISGNGIDEAEMGHHELIKTSFEWTEIGDCDKGNDLFDCGFIDIRNGVGNMSEISVTEERLNRLEYNLNVIKETKADDLVFNTARGSLRLSAEGKPLGTEIDLETPFGKELIVKLMD